MTLFTMLAAAVLIGLAPAGGPTPELAAESALEAPSAPLAGAIAPPAELTDKALLYEVVRHLYRWYIDERDLDGVVAANEVLFRVRELSPRLDEGDRSRFGEIVFPQFKLRVKVKKADYTIPELNVVVKNDAYRITSVTPVEDSTPPAANAVEIKADYTELRDELFRTRSRAAFPEGDLLERLRTAVRNQLLKEQPDLLQGEPKTQVIYLAPLSPVANETWVFWETGRAVIRFASDIDLTNPAVWDREELAVKLYALDKKVVVSLDEVAGSNAFMTRDEAGRALFNCVVLGRRMELTPGQPAGAGGVEEK